VNASGKRLPKNIEKTMERRGEKKHTSLKLVRHPTAPTVYVFRAFVSGDHDPKNIFDAIP
jgi:N-acetylmuramoyl-L-alanine amidase